MVASDRGQVLLLGGLAIAIVFLTAIPLSNSLVVTESASTSETVGDIDSAAQREADVERGVRRVLAGVNTSNLTAVNQSLRDFSANYSAVSGQGDGVYVNASVNPDASGRSLNRSELSNPGNNGTQPWDPVNNTTWISTFTIGVNETLGGGNPFEVTVTNSTGSTVYTLTATKSGSDIEVTTDDGSSVQSCGPADNVSVDLLAGTCSYGGTTESVASFSGSGETYDITFEDGGGSTEGDLTFVGAGNFYNDSQTSVVNLAVDLTFIGPDTSYTRTIWLSGDPLSSVARASPADGALYTGSGSGILQITGNNSATSTINTSSEPKGLGPASDVDSDGTIEVPYVDGSGDLRLVTSDGDETLLVDGSSSNIDNDKTRLAVGTWNGSDPSVFYANDTSAISRVEPGEDPVLVAEPDNGANAVIGSADIDGDGTDELVFADGSQTLRYLEDDGSTETIPNSGGVSLGSSDGIGSGGIADYDGDGEVAVAAVDGGNNIVIADASGDESIGSSDVDGGTAPDATQSPPTAADIDDDGVPELMYVSNTDGNITYLDNIEAGYGSGNIEIRKLTDEDGDPIPGDPETGVT
ncbi:hypothetical protein BRC96_06060 [Halobacteriales archaeon QS_6_64_34]|nr:MAG: hypothetical protein BRC96_06060 [Halobacteriales archaeon QS_6_64_34]